MEECHRRVGRVGPEYQSSRRGRGEQRRPLRRRVGNMGACPPPLRGRSAVCRPNAADPSGGPKIDSHVDFDSTAAWRHHVSMLPSSRSQSAATTALAGGTCELFRVKRLREIPQWWILGRCLDLPSMCSRGSRGGYPLAALGSEDWCNPSHGGVFSDGRPSVHGVAPSPTAPASSRGRRV